MTFRIRFHPRARYVRLRLESDGSLVVTVPRGFDRSRVPALVAERRGWIEQARQRLARARPPAELAGLTPSRIELPAVAETWAVQYQTPDGEMPRLTEIAGTLQISAPTSVPGNSVAGLLRNWLKTRARQHLVPRVRTLADRHGFRHGRITIRNQKTRWGSCSSRANLSLNARLLFLSPEACDYVLLHELIHTEHLNHSPAFWGRVAEVAPDYRQAMTELKAAWLAMPAWVGG